MSKKNVSRVTPKAEKKTVKAATKPQTLGIPLVSELKVRQPVVIAASRSWQTPHE